jgi:hypothetical protein
VICISSITSGGKKVAKGMFDVKLMCTFWIKNNHHNLLNLKAYKRGVLNFYGGICGISPRGWLKNNHQKRFIG